MRTSGLIFIILGILVFLLASINLPSLFLNYYSLFLHIYPLFFIFLGFSLIFDEKKEIFVSLAFLVIFLTFVALLIKGAYELKQTTFKIFVEEVNLTPPKNKIVFCIGNARIKIPKNSTSITILGGVGSIIFEVPKNVSVAFKGDALIGKVYGLKSVGINATKNVVNITSTILIGDIKFKQI